MIENFFFDFKSKLYFDHSRSKGVVNEYWKNGFLSIARTFSVLRIYQMRSTIQRRIQSKKFFLSEPISRNGFCSVDSEREPSRYRNLHASHAIQALPQWLSRNSIAQHTCECQLSKGLAHLRRLRLGTYRYCTRLVCGRRLRRTSQKNGLCIGFNDHRFMPLTFPLGKIPQTQSRCQDAHTSGCSWKHSIPYLDYQRESIRCHNSGFPCDRSGCILFARSWVSRLCSIAQHSFFPGFLHNPNKKQFPMSAFIFSYRQKSSWSSFRSNRHAYRVLFSKKLSGKGATYSILRQRNSETSDVFNQQFHAASHNNRPVIQMQMEDRTVFQMDQTASAYQSLLWNFRKCRQNTNLDCNLNLCFGSDRQKTFKPGRKSLHYFTDIKHHAFRETPNFTGTFRQTKRY